MALRSRGSEVAKALLSRHAASLSGARTMASGHGLDAAQTPLQQQASRCATARPPRLLRNRADSAARGHPRLSEGHSLVAFASQLSC